MAGPKKSIWEALAEHDGTPSGAYEGQATDAAIVGAGASGVDLSQTPAGAAALGDATIRHDAAALKKDPWAGVAPDEGLAGVQGNTSANDASLGALTGTMRVERPLDIPGDGPVNIRPQGYSTHDVGGDQIYEETFEGAPGRRDKAIAEMADIKAEKANKLADFYTQQTEQDVQAAAAAKARAAADQQNIQARQQKLDEATQFYTNDLADQGKFWTNPGNIVSAIAFSLMPIFSSDPTVGAKLINQAVDRDMANRQHAAQGTLGALTSNLAGYQKIAGDRQAGDLLARAEAHRIAAQEIERISLRFESPIAKKQAQIQIADQQTRARAAQMEFNKVYIAQQAQVMTPQMEAAQARGANGYRPGTMPYGGPGPQVDPNGAVPRGVGAGVNGSIGDKGEIPTTATAKKVSPTATALGNTGGATAIAKGAAKKMIPDEDAEEAMRAFYVRQAVSEGKKGPAIQANWHAAQVAAHEELSKVAEPLGKDIKASTTLVRLQNRMNLIEALATKNTKDPNDFVPWAVKSGLMPGEVAKQYRLLTGGDPRLAGNKAAELEAWRKTAVAHFQEEMAGQINQSRHDLSGGAVTPTESKFLEAEINPQMPWSDQKNWLDGRSRALQSGIEVSALHVNSPLGQVLYRMRTKGIGNNARPTTTISPPENNNAPDKVAARNALGIKGTIPEFTQ